MTHIRAVGEVIGAVFACKQLEKIRRFIRGSPGGIELDLVRFKLAQHLADTLKRLVPLNRLERVACPVIAQRMRQTTIPFQLKVRFSQQRRDGVFRQERGGNAFAGGFPGYRFGAVLTKLEGRFVFFIGPRAARAVKTIRLVGAQQRGGGIKGIHLGSYRNGCRF